MVRILRGPWRQWRCQWRCHREGRGQARGAPQDAAPGGPLWKVWFWRVLLPERATLTRRGMFESFGVCQSPGSIKVARARSGKRGYSAIPGTANIPAMDLLKELGKYVEECGDQPIVAFFCQYSSTGKRMPRSAGPQNPSGTSRSP